MCIRDSVYELFVTANDGLNGIFMNVNIVVDNVAVENHAPAFNDSAPLDLTVGEDTNINWSIATVAGSDADGNTLTYSLGGADAARFQINAGTGELFFDYWPDYERPADPNADNTHDLSLIHLQMCIRDRDFFAPRYFGRRWRRAYERPGAGGRV